VCADADVIPDSHGEAASKRYVRRERDIVVNVYPATNYHARVHHDSERVMVKPKVRAKRRLWWQHRMEYERVEVRENPGQAAPVPGVELVSETLNMQRNVVHFATSSS
jgi:hypothetical protein